MTDSVKGMGGAEMKVDSGKWRRTSLYIAAAKRLSHLQGEEGASLVEFAVVVPVLMFLLLGAATFSLGFYNLQMLQSATETAVQAVAATAGSVPDPCNMAMNTIQAALPGWTTANLSYSISITDSANAATIYTGTGNTFTCTAAGSSGGSTEEFPNTPVVLTVKYKYTWLPYPGSGNWAPLSTTEAAMAD